MDELRVVGIARWLSRTDSAERNGRLKSIDRRCERDGGRLRFANCEI